MASRTASVRLDHVTDQLFGDEADSALTVGAAASRLGITVRTFIIGTQSVWCARPGAVTGGYRLYTDADLGRIGRVLVYRDVGLSLDEIGILLDAPAAHVDETLRGQRAELRQRIADLEELGESLDRIIDARKSGVLLPAHEQVSIFGRHWQPSWGGRRRTSVGVTVRSGRSTRNGRRVGPLRIGRRSPTASRRSTKIWRWPADPVSNREAPRRICWQNGTERRSGGFTSTAHIRCRCVWDGCTWPIRDSPRSTSRSRPV